MVNARVVWFTNCSFTANYFHNFEMFSFPIIQRKKRQCYSIMSLFARNKHTTMKVVPRYYQKDLKLKILHLWFMNLRLFYSHFLSHETHRHPKIPMFSSVWNDFSKSMSPLNCPFSWYYVSFKFFYKLPGPNLQSQTISCHLVNREIEIRLWRSFVYAVWHSRKITNHVKYYAHRRYDWWQIYWL